MAVKTIEITRRIRDSIYSQIKMMSKEDQKNFYRSKAIELNKKLQSLKKTSV